MTIPQDELLAQLGAGAVWASGAGRHVLCARDDGGVWRSVTDVTEECRAAHRAGLIRFDGLLWHVAEAITGEPIDPAP